jgi:hypothetical protein
MIRDAAVVGISGGGVAACDLCNLKTRTLLAHP